MRECSAAAELLERRAYEELQCYTLAHGDPVFIHQHVVDAWAAFHEVRHDAAELLRPYGIG